MGNWVVLSYVISDPINGADKSTVALPCRNLCSKFNVCQDWPSKPCKPTTLLKKTASLGLIHGESGTVITLLTRYIVYIPSNGNYIHSSI